MSLWLVLQDYRVIKSNLKVETYVHYKMFINGELADWKNKRMVDISKDMVSKRLERLLASNSPFYNFAKGQYEGRNGNILFPNNPVERLSQLGLWAKESRRQTVIRPMTFVSKLFVEEIEALTGKRL